MEEGSAFHYPRAVKEIPSRRVILQFNGPEVKMKHSSRGDV
jgi:hypothetical protein